MMKILAEKQEATELFIEAQQEGAISEAEAWLAELEERSKMLRESQGQIADVHSLSDTELIKVCNPCYYSIIHSAQTEKLQSNTTTELHFKVFVLWVICQ